MMSAHFSEACHCFCYLTTNTNKQKRFGNSKGILGSFRLLSVSLLDNFDELSESIKNTSKRIIEFE